MGYLKYQMEGEQISFGNGEWYFTGNKRKSDNVVGRYLSSGNCEGNCDECNKVELTYSNGNIRTIPYDCNAENSMLKYDEILSISDDNCPVSSITSMEIGDCVTSIYRMYEGETQPLFRQPNLTSISSVTFSNNLTSISAPFFQHSSGLTEVSFPDSLVYIGGSAFYDCPNLKTIRLNEGLKVIGSGACKNCTSLSSVTFPSTILQIRYEAFRDCTSLEEIHVLSKIPPALGDNAFYGTNYCPIYVPCGSVELYKNTSGWRNFSDRITCIDAVNLVEFTMPSGLKKYYPCTEAGRIDNSLLSGSTNAVDMVIGECAKSIIGRFSAMTNLQDCEITIPNNSYIANHAFDGTSGITSLTLGSGCTYEHNTGQLGSQFANMPDLAELNFVDGVDKISYDSFKGCTSLSSVTIPDSVTSIYSGAFSGCTNLRTFTVGSGVTFIDNYVIDNSPNLEAIYIYSKQISRIGTSAFDRYGGTCPIYVPCDKYYDYSSFFGAEQAARLVPMDGCPQVARVTGVTLSETAKTLNHLETFTLTPTVLPSEAANKNVTWSSSNSGICTVDSNGLVNGVGEGNAVITVTTFDGGYTATCDVTVNEVFSGKFYAVYSNGTDYAVGCDSNTTLASATTQPSGYVASEMTSANIGDCVTRIGDYVFYRCTSLSSVAIPSGLTSIGAYAFYNCSSLTSIDIPSGVTIIGQRAFSDCTSLSSVTIPNNVETIGSSAFYNCSSLTSIDIPNSVYSIEENTFYYCSSLTSITIPSSVYSIGYSTFYNCRNLTSITVNRTTPPSLGRAPWGEYNAFGNTNNCPIYVPAESVATYKTATGWKNYASRIQAIPN